jgi:membrane-bound acyltransferase YfiQ involved in biofilm formation
MAGQRTLTSKWMERLPLALLLAMSSLAVAAVLVAVTRPVAPGTAVALGTVALAAVTVLLAFLASRWGVVEAGWLVYPMLALTGLKVVTQDLTAGRALVLVVALAAYGFALVVAPWLLRSGHSADTDQTAVSPST